MKNQIFTIVCGCFFYLFPITSQSQNNITPNFKLTCSVKGADGKLIILGNKPASGIDESFKIQHFDSCYSKNDSFQFSFYTSEPGWYSIEIDGTKGWKSFVAVPNGQIGINGNSDSIYKSKISGSTEDSIYYELTKGLLFPLYAAMRKASPDSFKLYPAIINKAKYDFIKQHSSSFVVAKYLVSADSYNRIKDPAQLRYLQKCYLALSIEAKQFECSKSAYYNLFVASKTLSVSNKLPGFTFVNYKGSTFNLYQYLKKENKKYYLIDFWATWCAPCIAEFPKLGDVYNKFKKDGFGIIGYSLDIHKDKLDNFLVKHKLEWNNISDLKGEASLVYKLFKLGTLPSNYLIDRNAIILGVNLTPENISKILTEKLSE